MFGGSSFLGIVAMNVGFHFSVAGFRASTEAGGL